MNTHNECFQCNKEFLDRLEFCYIDNQIIIISYLYQYLSIISLC